MRRPAPDGSSVPASGSARSLRGFWGSEHRNPALALATVAAAAFIGSAPLGIYGIGIVRGSVLALSGLALVLVYRSNRIINFAQAAYGLSAAMLFSSLVQHRTLLRLIEPLCVSDCVNDPVAVQVNYWLALVLSMAVAVAFGWLTHLVVVRRFASAPRLLLTVATIFVGYLVVGLTSEVVQRLVPEDVRERGGPPPGTEPAHLPFDFVVRIGGVNFHAVEFLTVAVALGALAWLIVYLRRSATGNAIRAASENPDRAATLGVNVAGVTARVWVIAAGLAGAAGILGAMSQGTAGAAGGPGTEIRILAVAVIARMVSLPLVAAAALALGLLEQSMQWTFGSPDLFDGSLFALIAILLLFQSRAGGREIQLEEWRAAKEVRPTPRELRALPVVRSWARTGGGICALLLLGAPWALSPARTNLAAVVMIYAMIGLSLLVLTGWAGQISLGQVAFAAIGAYVAAVSHLPFVVAMLAGGLAGAVAALVTGIPALRLRGLHLAVITLAFHQAVVAVGLNPKYLGRYLPEGLERPSLLGMHLDDQRVFYYVTLAIAIAVVLAVLGMRRSRTARALIAARDNEQAAQAFGIGLTRARVGAFAVAGFIAAFAGALLAYHQNGVQGAAFGVGLSRTIFLHAVIGGLGTVAGPLIGLVYYGLPLLVQTPGLIALMLSGPGGLLLLLYTPGGLAQILFDARDAWLRRVARRNRIPVPSVLADAREAAAGERVTLAPKTRPGGGLVFVPSRYRLPSQWAIGERDGG